MQGWFRNSIAQSITISLEKQEKWKQWLPLFLESYLHWAEEFDAIPTFFIPIRFSISLFKSISADSDVAAGFH